MPYLLLTSNDTNGGGIGLLSTLHRVPSSSRCAKVSPFLRSHKNYIFTFKSNFVHDTRETAGLTRTILLHLGPLEITRVKILMRVLRFYRNTDSYYCTTTHWFVESVRRDTAESLSLAAVLTSDAAVLQLSRRPALSLSPLQCPANQQSSELSL